MRVHAIIALALVPTALVAQAPAAGDSSLGVMLSFEKFADIFGSRLVAAFDSIPANRYAYRPTPAQQTIGFIAQHLEHANYGLCGQMSDLRRRPSAKDTLPGDVKAGWPKDTLVARLKASLRFCDSVLDRVPRLESPALASTLLAFETDLAEHYSQLSVYMRLLGMVPPSALPARRRKAIALAPSALPPFVGAYQLLPGVQLEVSKQGDALYVRSSLGGDAVRLWPESAKDFFVKEVEAQITFTRDADGRVTGLVLHQYGRDRPAAKLP
jgi:hypothetical protein